MNTFKGSTNSFAWKARRSHQVASLLCTAGKICGKFIRQRATLKGRSSMEYENNGGNAQ